MKSEIRQIYYFHLPLNPREKYKEYIWEKIVGDCSKVYMNRGEYIFSSCLQLLGS